MKKIIVLAVSMGIIFIFGSFKNSSSGHYGNALEKNTIQANANIKDYAFYVGYFWATDPDNPPLALGKVKVYARDTRTFDSPILTAKIIGPREDNPVAFQASGDYHYVNFHSGYVTDFDGYVTYGGKQYHIQYTGEITFP